MANLSDKRLAEIEDELFDGVGRIDEQFDHAQFRKNLQCLIDIIVEEHGL